MSRKAALVLSGGGARGMAHIGVIEELEKRNYEIVSVTGTSMGSVVGAVYAMGKLEEFKSWLYSLDKLKVFRLMDFTLSKQGLLKGFFMYKIQVHRIFSILSVVFSRRRSCLLLQQY